MQTNVAFMQDKSGGLAWDDVRLFLAVSRAPTIGVAGQALGVDASTVSRRLDALEAGLAMKLFERGRGGVTPTKAAEDLMPAAERIEEAIAGFTGAAAELERAVADLVRLTCPADVAEIVVAPLLPELLGRHPALRVDLEAGEATRDLARREADIALRTVRPERGDLVVVRLLSIRWVLAAAPDVVRRIGPLRAWDAAAWVGWGDRFAHTPPAVWRARHVRSVEPSVRSDSLRVQLSLLSAGVGMALVPEPSIAAYGLAPVRVGAALREVAATWPTSELFLVTHRALRDVPRVRVVWELLAGRLGPQATARASKS